jgi:hypothetical protein
MPRKPDEEEERPRAHTGERGTTRAAVSRKDGVVNECAVCVCVR